MFAWFKGNKKAHFEKSLPPSDPTLPGAGEGQETLILMPERSWARTRCPTTPHLAVSGASSFLAALSGTAHCAHPSTRGQALSLASFRGSSVTQGCGSPFLHGARPLHSRALGCEVWASAGAGLSGEKACAPACLPIPLGAPRSTPARCQAPAPSSGSAAHCGKRATCLGG